VPLTQAAPPATAAIQRSVAARGGLFAPLSDEELKRVRITRNQARAAALEAGGRQEPALTEVGFVYLGRWSPPPQSLGHAPMPPPIAAYIVQLAAKPAPGFPEGTTAFVIVDAASGGALVVFGGCDGRDCQPES
jgi:hypothetical protein